MKKIIFLILLIANTVVAQKELWATGVEGGIINNYPNGSGGIFKANFNGENIQDIHLFDSINGYKPYGRLLVASNGKLYGTASEGGLYCTPFREGGVLYEYDLILNKFRVVANLGSTTQFTSTNRPINGVIEPVQGVLYGASEDNAIYKYTIATETLSISANVPNFTSQLNVINNSIRGELMKASNGLVYGTTKNFSNNPNGTPYLGSIARLNTTTNNFSLVYPFESGFGGLYAPTGGLIEGVSGKLYGTTRLGGTGIYVPSDQFNLGGGTLFEYIIATNTLTKKIDFDYNTLGSSPFPLCLGLNGKLYGILANGGQGSTPSDPSIHYGSLFEYDITTNSINIVKDFGYQNGNYEGIGAKGSLIKGSDNNLYGIASAGIFKYEPLTNTFTQFTNFYLSMVAPSSSGELLEICRKPSYHEILVNSFDICVGSTFTYDIQNTNAVSYQWIKDSVNVIGQTTSTLNIQNATLLNAGTYTCLMTNECGITTTTALNLSVNCLGTNTVANLDKSIKLYPNPAKELLNIELPSNINVTIESCKLTNLLGQTINQHPINNKIDISQLQAGIYIISFQTNYGKWNGKFVKN